MIRRRKILIIDDDPVTVKCLKTRLNAHGYGVITAFDGVSGLKKARTEKPDLITLDVMLPELNGYSVCGFLKSDDRLKSIPVIMLTVRKSPLDQEFSEELSPEDYFTKPFNMDELLNRIQELLPV